MRCPTLKELPCPPSNKTGWPWTEESSQLPDKMPDGSQWPRITIVTPSFNQGQFIEETIRSVLLQGFPNLEYLIIDGGSADETLGIIQKYEKWIAYWVSQEDRGQSHAINKGIDKCSGDIFAWINSDDFYCVGALSGIAEAMWQDGEIAKPVAYGHAYWVDESGKIIAKSHSTTITKHALIRFWRPRGSINQPSFFLSASLVKEYHLNESLHFALDWELWLRLSGRYDFLLLPQFLSFYRFYSDSKSGGGRKSFFKEQIKISKKYWSSNKFAYFQTWLSYQNYLFKQPFVKFWLLIKAIVYVLLGENNYEALKRIKNKILRKSLIRTENSKQPGL